MVSVLQGGSAPIKRARDQHGRMIELYCARLIWLSHVWLCGVGIVHIYCDKGSRHCSEGMNCRSPFWGIPEYEGRRYTLLPKGDTR